MAEITNPVVIAAVGEIVRPSATAMVARYWDAKAKSTEWTEGGIAPLCGVGADEIKDAANPVAGVGNGKKPLTAFQCKSVMKDLADFCLWFETDGRLARMASVASHLAPFDEANRG